MSDTREQEQKDLVAAGIEDSLGAALSSSFTLPPAEPKPKPAASESIPSAPAEPVAIEGGSEDVEDWKSSYEANLAHWRAEADVVREKAAATRKRFEDSASSAQRAEAEKAQTSKRAVDAAKRETEQAERLKRLLEAGAETSKTREGDEIGEESGSSKGNEERERKIKKAWEMVEDTEAGDEGVEHITDDRGAMEVDKTMAIDKEGSRVVPPPTGYDPISSIQPITPSLQDVTPSPELPLPTESATLSRHSATSQTWEEISGDLSSGEDLSPPRTGSSGDDLPTAEAGQSRSETRGLIKLDDKSYVKFPISSSAAPVTGGPESVHPASTGIGNFTRAGGTNPSSEPPSLTLSLFTAPSHLSIPRVLAVLGINLVLPFINGVMYGFGEIFAKETVGIARLWWRGERAVFGWWRGGRPQGGEFGAARGVAGVGLSGSGSFP